MQRLFAAPVCLLLCLWVGALPQGVIGQEQDDEPAREPHTLEQKLQQSSDGSVVLLEEDISLYRPLVIQKPVILRGRKGKNKITVTCSRQNSALHLRSSGVVLENFIVRNCLAPAVIIGDQFSLDSGRIHSAQFSLSHMEFYENSLGKVNAEGGALYIGEATNVTISKSIFEDNIASSGGAIYVNHGDLTVSDSHFRRNIATSYSGGAIHAQDFNYPLLDTVQSPNIGNLPEMERKSLKLIRTTFEDNIAAPLGVGFDLERGNGGPIEVSNTLPFKKPSPSGGAIFSLTYEVDADSCLFKGNRASTGGAMYLKDNGKISVSNCKFIDNHLKALVKDIEQGGAIYIFSIKTSFQVNIRDSIFRNNTGVLGGALHMLVPFRSGVVTVKSSVFEGNKASSSGGAALIRNGDSVDWFNCTFVRNVAQSGGALLLTNGGGSRFDSSGRGQGACQFLENIAMDGGAVLCRGAGITYFLGVYARGNRALRNGGALALINSIAGAGAHLERGLYEGNTAYRGGAIYSDGMIGLEMKGNPKVDFGHIVFKNNRASTGGGMYISVRNPESNEVVISNALVSGNIADKDFQVDYGLVEELAETIQEMNDEHDDGYGVKEMQEIDLAGCGLGGGGGLCLGLVSVPERALVKVEFVNSAFEKNRATNGGGLHIRSIGGRWAPRCRADETPLSFSRCRSLSMVGSNFTDNIADGAGGSIFTNRPGDFFVDCEPLQVAGGKRNSLASMDSFCSQWTGQIVGTHGYGGVVASIASEIRVSGVNAAAVTNHTSGKALPAIKLEVLDEFSQVIKGGISDSNLSVSARSNVVRGQLDATAHRGIATFDSLVLTAPPGNYMVTFQGESIKSVEVDVTIRDCFIGEEIICPGQPNCSWGEHTGCQLCEKDFFSLNPNESCTTCPSNAQCSGGATMVPSSGYWHSSPFSPIIQECLFEKACAFEGREKSLEEFYANRENLLVTAEMSENYTQCREGYSSVLCGSCEPGYGRMSHGECAKCKEDKKESKLIISAIALWALILVVIGIKSALNTTRDLQDMQAIAAHRTMNADGSAPHPPVSPCRVNHPDPESLERRDYSSSIGSQNALIPDLPTDLTLDIIQNMDEKYADIDHITASEDMSEAAKILVNFLQVTSIAVAINVEWTSFIKRLLEAQDIFAGFSNGSGVISLDCVISDNPWMTRSIASLVMRLSFPFVILFVVLLFFFLYWCYLRWTVNESKDYLVSRFIISGLCVLFFTYALVTKDLMRTVNCVTVDTGADDDKRYHEFAISYGKYWGEDTNLECFTGEHALLAFCVGVPGLCLISVGAPLYLAYFLNKNKARLNDRDFLNTYGFAYQAYKEKNVYWDALVMARKAVIGVVVVFAYPLGGNLQGVLALGVLLLALVLHMYKQPFRNTKLNVLEAASLVVSALTFYLGIMFNDPKTSTLAEVIFSAFLFLVMVLFVTAAIYQVYLNLDLYLVARLRHLNVRGTSDTWGFWKKAKKLVFAELPIGDTGEVVAELGRTLTKKVGTIKRVLSLPRLSVESGGECSSSMTSTITTGSLDKPSSAR